VDFKWHGIDHPRRMNDKLTLLFELRQARHIRSHLLNLINLPKCKHHLAQSLLKT